MIVRSAEIREPWEPFRRERDRNRDERKRAKESAERAAQRMIERITDLLPEGFEARDILPQQHYNGAWSTYVKIEHTRLANLLEAAGQNALEQTRE